MTETTDPQDSETVNEAHGNSHVAQVPLDLHSSPPLLFSLTFTYCMHVYLISFKEMPIFHFFMSPFLLKGNGYFYTVLVLAHAVSFSFLLNTQDPYKKIEVVASFVHNSLSRCT